ncbi:hypothetical protein AKJ16_DCAP06626 [Drosera capensis]
MTCASLLLSGRKSQPSRAASDAGALASSSGGAARAFHSSRGSAVADSGNRRQWSVRRGADSHNQSQAGGGEIDSTASHYLRRCSGSDLSSFVSKFPNKENKVLNAGSSREGNFALLSPIPNKRFGFPRQEAQDEQGRIIENASAVMLARQE